MNIVHESEKADVNSIRKTLELICEPGAVHEVRVPDSTVGVLAGWFTDRESQAWTIYYLTQGEGKYPGRFGPKAISPPSSVYMMLNPVHADFMSVSGNTMKAIGKGEGSKDEDVVRLKRLFLDFDPWRMKGISSTHAGLEQAGYRANEVCKELEAIGFPAPLFGFSGNGTNLIYGIDLPNDVKSEKPVYAKLVEDFVKAISAKYGDPCEHGKTLYDDNLIHIDPVVFNPSRIATVYGTWKRKGTSTAERPHRLSGIIECPEKLEPIPEELLRLAIDHMRLANKTTVDMGGAKEVVSEIEPDPDILKIVQGEADRLDTGEKLSTDKVEYVRAVLDRHKVKLGFTISEPKIKGVFTHIEIKPCLFNPSEHTKATVSVHAKGKVSYLCPHKSCKGEKEGFERKTWADVLKLFGEPPEPVATNQEKPAKPDPVAVLVKLARENAEFWRSTEGEGYATLTVDGHKENHPLHSCSFIEWLIGMLWELTGKSAKADHVKQAIGVLNHLARQNRHRLYIRTAKVQDRIYIDLGDESWRAVEVDRSGWRIISNPPVKFRRVPSTDAMPEPIRGGSVDLLQPLLGVRDDAWTLIKGYLMASMSGSGPYFHLALSGEPGSGKSFTSRSIKRLVDPVTAGELGRLPGNEEGFGNHGYSEHLIAYDNVSSISKLQSDCLCVLSTGGGIKVRKLYENSGQVIFDHKRPCILNGIPDYAERTDLADRCINLFLTAPAERQTERALWSKFEQVRPLVLGGLLDLLVIGLRELEATEVVELPRMADAVHWVTACTGSKAFLELYRENRDGSLRNALDSSPVAGLLRGMLEGADPHNPAREKGYWRGTAGELLEALKSWASTTGASLPKSFPETPRGLGGQIRRDAMALRVIGIEVSYSTCKGRDILTFSQRESNNTTETTTTEGDSMYTPIEKDEEDEMPVKPKKNVTSEEKQVLDLIRKKIENFDQSDPENKWAVDQIRTLMEEVA